MFKSSPAHLGLMTGDILLVTEKSILAGVGFICVRKIYGSDFPLVLADRHSLVDVVAVLLNYPQRMSEIRIKSREYIEKYHDCKEVELDLLKSYKSSKTG